MDAGRPSRAVKKGAEMISAFHGLAAYRGSASSVAIKRALDTALSGVELCAADRPIGPLGAVFLGECSILHSQDVWSEIGPDGLRYVARTSGWQGDFREWIPRPDQALFEATCQRWQAECADPLRYAEAWMEPIALRALWVKQWASAETKKAACIIARHRKVPLINVSSESRVWDLLDGHNLPCYRSAT